MANAVALLSNWVRAGAHRRDLNKDGGYENSDAISIMDAWWPRWMSAEFERPLGKTLFDGVRGLTTLDDSPNIHLGSAYDG